VHMRMVLETLLHHKLYARASKCLFCPSSVGFHCYVISEHCVSVDPQGRCCCRVGHAAVLQRRAPLRQPNQLLPQVCAVLLCPLTTLCSSHGQFVWGDLKQWSFDVLKAALKSVLVLRECCPFWPPTWYSWLPARQFCSRSVQPSP
jgi:hypothetical protein